MRTNAIERNEKGTNLSVSESFLFRSFCNFVEIVPASFLLEKNDFVPFSFLILRNTFLEFLDELQFAQSFSYGVIGL